MPLRSPSAALLVGASLLFQRAARGDGPPLPGPVAPAFGSPGQWVVSGSSSAGVSTQTFSGSAADFVSASFGPVVDVFIARGWSLGLTGSIAYSDNKGYGVDGSLVDTQTGTLRVGPRVGYAVSVGRAVTLWPTARLGFEWAWQNQSVVSGSTASVAGDRFGYPNSTVSGPWVALDLALLWHVAPHLFLGIAPEIFHAFATYVGGPNLGGQESWVSGGFLVGGWLGGRPGPDDAATVRGVPPPTTRDPRFGAAGQIVLDSELALDAAWIGYERSPSQSASGGVDGAVDYFVADHVSAGGGVGLALSSSTGIDSTTGGTTTAQGVDWDIFGRVGVDLPLAERVSLWPRVSLGYGWRHLYQAEAGSTVEIDRSVYLSLYVPVLVHPASHFFVGLGPSIAHDLSHAVTDSSSLDAGAAGPAQQNRSTTIGAGLIVGGWL